jgi:hypothetical protein
LASPIDESHYVARESSSGGSLSVGYGTGSVSLSLDASQLKLLADFEGVRRQSAFTAGEGGYYILNRTGFRGGLLA